MKKAGWVAVCCTLLGGVEGVRTVAYKDPVGIPTICVGETLGVKLGQTATREECDSRLAQRLIDDFGPGVDRCIGKELPPARKAAYASVAYNIGVGAFCTSSMARQEKAGNPAAACDAILLWNKPLWLRGIALRREKERALCREGLT